MTTAPKETYFDYVNGVDSLGTAGTLVAPFKTLNYYLDNFTKDAVTHDRFNFINNADHVVTEISTAIGSANWGNGLNARRYLFRGVDASGNPLPFLTQAKIVINDGRLISQAGYDRFYFESLFIECIRDTVTGHTIALDNNISFANCKILTSETVGATTSKCVDNDQAGCYYQTYARRIIDGNDAQTVSVASDSLIASSVFVNSSTHGPSPSAIRFDGEDCIALNNIVICDDDEAVGIYSGSAGYVENNTIISTAPGGGVQPGILFGQDRGVSSRNYIEGFSNLGGKGLELQAAVDFHAYEDEHLYNNQVAVDDQSDRLVYGNHTEPLTSQVDKAGNYDDYAAAFTYANPIQPGDLTDHDIMATGLLHYAGAIPPEVSGTPTGEISGTSSVGFDSSATLTDGAGDALAGSSSVGFSATGTLTAANSIAGSSTLAFDSNAAIVGVGALGGTSSVSFDNSAILAAAGIVAGTSSASFSAIGTLDVPGAVRGASPVSFSSSGTLSATAALVASSSTAFGANAALSAAYTLAGSSSVAFSSSAILGATVDISGTSSVAFSAIARLVNGSDFVNVPGVEFRFDVAPPHYRYNGEKLHFRVERPK